MLKLPQYGCNIYGAIYFRIPSASRIKDARIVGNAQLRRPNGSQTSDDVIKTRTRMFLWVWRQISQCP